MGRFESTWGLLGVVAIAAPAGAEPRFRMDTGDIVHGTQNVTPFAGVAWSFGPE